MIGAWAATLEAFWPYMHMHTCAHICAPTLIEPTHIHKSSTNHTSQMVEASVHGRYPSTDGWIDKMCYVQTTNSISSSLCFPHAGILALYFQVPSRVSVLRNQVLETAARDVCTTMWMCSKPQLYMLNEVETVTYLYLLEYQWNLPPPHLLTSSFFPVQELSRLLWKSQNEKMITCHKIKLNRQLWKQ